MSYNKKQKHPGVGYRGGKSRYVSDLVKSFPKRENFVDLFAGGCSVTHHLIRENKYQNYYINDLDYTGAQIFEDAVKQSNKINEFLKLTPSKEDFDSNKHSDPYKKLLWSFSSNMRGFLYAKDKDMTTNDLIYEFCRGETDKVNLDGLEITSDKTDFLERLYEVNKKSKIKCGDRLRVVSRIERVLSIKEEAKDWDLSKLHFSKKDYSEVEIPPNSLIYCDIPYKGSEMYPRNSVFDYERFYKWADSQENVVLVSEFYMPEDKWQVLYSKDLNMFSNNLAVTKRKDCLWIRKDQLHLL